MVNEDFSGISFGDKTDMVKAFLYVIEHKTRSQQMGIS